MDQVKKLSIGDKMAARIEEASKQESLGTKVTGSAGKFQAIEPKVTAEPEKAVPQDSDIPSDLGGEPLPPIVEEEVDELDQLKVPEKNAEAFKELRQIYKTKLANKIDKLTKGLPVVDLELEKKLRNELNETKKKLASYSITEDEDFVNQYDKPLQNSYKQLIDIVKSLDGDEAIVNTALRMGYKDRIKFINSKLPDATSLILPMMSNLDVLNSTRTKAIENYDTEKNRLRQARFERETKVKEELHGGAFNQALNKLTETEKHVFLLKSASDKSWNSIVDQRIELARNILRSDDAGLRAETVLRAVVSQDYAKAYAKSQERVKELEKELGIRSKMRSGGSKAGSGEISPSKPDRKEIGKMGIGKWITRDMT